MESNGNSKDNDTPQGGYSFTFPEYPGSFQQPAHALFLHQCLTNSGNPTQNNEYPRQTPNIRISIDKSGNATVKKPQPAPSPAPSPMTLLNNPFKGLGIDSILLAQQNKRRCEICQKVLTKQGFQIHQKTHDKFRDKIKCFCGKDYFKETITRHLVACHSNDIRNNPRLRETFVYICGVCKESFYGEDSLKTHKESQHN